MANFSTEPDQVTKTISCFYHLVICNATSVSIIESSFLCINHRMGKEVIHSHDKMQDFPFFLDFHLNMEYDHETVISEAMKICFNLKKLNPHIVTLV